MDDLGHNVTVFGVINGWSKKIFPRHAPEALVGLAPSFNRARDGDAVNPVLGHRRNAVFCQKLDGKSTWRPAARIQAVEFASLRLPVNEKQITADSVVHRLGDAEHGIGSNRSVDRRPTLSEDLASG